MLDKIKHLFFRLYHTVRGSIGYYPALITLLLSSSAIILLSIENPELTKYIKEKAGFLIIDNADTARAVLSTLIGGVISLTVFSFSMVMILLNQASNNFSPRLLPGLISNKPHQIVLGCYIGTILFNIISLINVLPGDDPFQIPAFTILIGILLGPLCLVLFVFFIHSISQAIQIDNILERVYEETCFALKKMNKKIETNAPSSIPQKVQEDWFPITGCEYGILVNISEKDLIELAVENDTVFFVAPPRGMTTLEGSTILYSSKKLEASIEARTLLSLHLSNQEVVIENYLFGFKQLTEVILRAMSPGINDPGTAITAFDYLVALFAKRMKIGDYLSVSDQENTTRLYYNTVPFKDLAYYCFAAIRTYTIHDPVIVSKLLHGFNYLLDQDMEESNYKTILLAERQVLWSDAKTKIKNPHDLERLKFLMMDPRRKKIK